MKQSILAVFILAMMTIVLAPSASAITVDPLKLQAEQPVKKEKPRPKPKVEVKIPKIEAPVEYIVISGDTLSKIAADHQTTVQRLWQKNIQLTNPDLLNIGDKLIIPTASEVLADRPLQSNVAHAPQPARPVIPGNAYAPGYCTWYVKNMRPDLPNYLGDASAWYYSAQAQGLPTGTTPAVGAVGVAQVGYMHVVYITGVNGDGTVNLSEMNYKGLYIESTRTAPASDFLYIY